MKTDKKKFYSRHSSQHRMVLALLMALISTSPASADAVKKSKHQAQARCILNSKFARDLTAGSVERVFEGLKREELVEVLRKSCAEKSNRDACVNLTMEFQINSMSAALEKPCDWNAE